MSLYTTLNDLDNDDLILGGVKILAWFTFVPEDVRQQDYHKLTPHSWFFLSHTPIHGHRCPYENSFDRPDKRNCHKPAHGHLPHCQGGTSPLLGPHSQ